MTPPSAHEGGEREESPVVWEHRCDDGVGGCTAVSASYWRRVAAVLKAGDEWRTWRNNAGPYAREQQANAAGRLAEALEMAERQYKRLTDA